MYVPRYDFIDSYEHPNTDVNVKLSSYFINGLSIYVSICNRKITEMSNYYVMMYLSGPASLPNKVYWFTQQVKGKEGIDLCRI